MHEYIKTAIVVLVVMAIANRVSAVRTIIATDGA